MKLWLNFKDEDGVEQRLAVDAELFTVGRHSANDLTVTDSRLSREHLRIERVGAEFTASDPGSSNGTTLNGRKLTGPESINDGDTLDLGGGLLVKIELESEPDEPSADLAPVEPAAPDLPPPAVPAYAAPPAASGGIPMSFFIIAPIMGLLVLAIVGGGYLLFAGGQDEVAENGYNYPADDDDLESKDNEDVPTPKKTSTPKTGETPLKGETNAALPSPGPGGPEVPTADLSETSKVERNGAAFLRRIAQNDPKAFLTGEQAQKVNAKVKQIGKAAALAENINAARKNAAQIKALAVSKNLKPQFLAVAAITKLGSGRGDVVQAAQSVADVYDKLATQIGNEFGEDALLMVAAFDQGTAGDTMKMRNMLQDLANKSTEGVRTIRTIWFLEKSGKISQSEFDRALNFLAIGTITQNPKDFGVNAEALTL